MNPSYPQTYPQTDLSKCSFYPQVIHKLSTAYAQIRHDLCTCKQGYMLHNNMLAGFRQLRGEAVQFSTKKTGLLVGRVKRGQPKKTRLLA